MVQKKPVYHSSVERMTHCTLDYAAPICKQNVPHNTSRQATDHSPRKRLKRELSANALKNDKAFISEHMCSLSPLSPEKIEVKEVV